MEHRRYLPDIKMRAEINPGIHTSVTLPSSRLSPLDVKSNGAPLRNTVSDFYLKQQFNTDKIRPDGDYNTVVNTRKKKVIFSNEISSTDNDFVSKVVNGSKDSTNNNQYTITAQTQQLLRMNIATLHRSTIAILLNKNQSKKSSLKIGPSTGIVPLAVKPSNYLSSKVDIGIQRRERISLPSEEQSTNRDYNKQCTLNARKDSRNEEIKTKTHYILEPARKISQSNNIFPGRSKRSSAEKLKSLKGMTQAQRQNSIGVAEHPKSKDECNNNTVLKPTIRFGSSNVFQTVIVDMYGNSDYGRLRCFKKPSSHAGNIALYATKFLGKLRAHKKLKNLENRIQNKENKTDNYFKAIRDNDKTSRRRGWRILLKYFHEMNSQTQASQVTKNWNLLRQTLDDLDILKHTRRDLYERYGVIPFVNSDGAIVQENTMLSDRAKSLLPELSRNYKGFQRHRSNQFMRSSNVFAIQSGFNKL